MTHKLNRIDIIGVLFDKKTNWALQIRLRLRNGSRRNEVRRD